MSNSYESLLRNLNVVKWELKNRNDPSLNVCIKYIKDAIVDAGRLNNELTKLEVSSVFKCGSSDLDVCDCVD